jgi:hypothetical protein
MEVSAFQYKSAPLVAQPSWFRSHHSQWSPLLSLTEYIFMLKLTFLSIPSAYADYRLKLI